MVFVREMDLCNYHDHIFDTYQNFDMYQKYVTLLSCVRYMVGKR